VWDWQDWTATTTSWSQLAAAHAKRQSKPKDEVLQTMLKQHSIASPAEKHALNRQIWRHRRAKQRWKAKQALLTAAQKGAFPKSAPKHITVNWTKLGDGRDPGEAMSEYYERMYSLADHTAEEESKEKAHWIGTWKSLRIDIIPHRVTIKRLTAAVARLKCGKGSPDACTAEMYKQLPDNALVGLAVYFTWLLAQLCFPDAWTVVHASLIPKIIGASSFDKFRAIACLPVARKLLGYLWLQMLPNLHYSSFQCGFVPGSHAANGVYVLKRAAELSREWGKSLYMVQLDLTKAFDRVLHSAVVRALRLQSASLQCIAVICGILLQSKAAATLGHISAKAVNMLRGLPQGAPESPIIFTLITELVLRPLMVKWRTEGLCWSLDGLQLSAICYADDIILVSESKSGLEKMLADIVRAFGDVGLEVSLPKCHWTSYPAKRHATLKCATNRLAWEPSLVFVGTVLDVGGNDGLAIDYRVARASKVFYKWRSALQSPRASLKCRIRLCYATVFAALLWLAETWYPTKQQTKRVESWAARTLGKLYGVKMGVDGDVAEYWRRLHRVGHELLASAGGGIDVCRRRQLHAFAGHVVRAVSGPARQAFETRSMQWWRECQARGIFTHPRRFKAWRWEEQFTSFYGESRSFFLDEDTGWRQLTLDRSEWRTLAAPFSNRHA